MALVQRTNGFNDNGRNWISLAVNFDHCSLYVIWDFWKYHHSIHYHSKYIGNPFFFAFVEEFLHKVLWEAFTFFFLPLYLANNLSIYSHNLRHLFNKSRSLSFLTKDLVRIGCHYPKQNCVLFDSRSHVLLVKVEAPI